MIKHKEMIPWLQTQKWCTAEKWIEPFPDMDIYDEMRSPGYEFKLQMVNLDLDKARIPKRRPCKPITIR